ncbi:hypothetical protein B0H13DRAFT_2303247 [Mycena leptocephala]|nr:hypothetical protein B0H13DRAFT_2303247 [Mycena leptocephala]
MALETAWVDDEEAHKPSMNALVAPCEFPALSSAHPPYPCPAFAVHKLPSDALSSACHHTTLELFMHRAGQHGGGAHGHPLHRNIEGVTRPFLFGHRHCTDHQATTPSRTQPALAVMTTRGRSGLTFPRADATPAPGLSLCLFSSGPHPCAHASALPIPHCRLPLPESVSLAPLLAPTLLYRLSDPLPAPIQTSHSTIRRRLTPTASPAAFSFSPRSLDLVRMACMACHRLTCGLLWAHDTGARLGTEENEPQDDASRDGIASREMRGTQRRTPASTQTSHRLHSSHLLLVLVLAIRANLLRSPTPVSATPLVASPYLLSALTIPLLAGKPAACPNPPVLAPPHVVSCVVAANLMQISSPNFWDNLMFAGAEEEFSVMIRPRRNLIFESEPVLRVESKQLNLWRIQSEYGVFHRAPVLLAKRVASFSCALQEFCLDPFVLSMEPALVLHITACCLSCGKWAVVTDIGSAVCQRSFQKLRLALSASADCALQGAKTRIVLYSYYNVQTTAELPYRHRLFPSPLHRLLSLCSCTWLHLSEAFLASSAEFSVSTGRFSDFISGNSWGVTNPARQAAAHLVNLLTTITTNMDKVDRSLNFLRWGEDVPQMEPRASPPDFDLHATGEPDLPISP